MDNRHPNSSSNSSSHSYSRTSGPLHEYVTEYRTTLPAPRPPVSTNIATYTYKNPQGQDFQSTVTTKDFAPVIRSTTYGRPPPPEFGLNSDLEFQKIANFPSHRPIVGNTSSSSSRFSSNASANGNVSIVEVSAEGKFIVVENTHGSKEEPLAGWKIKRNVDGRPSLVYHFPASVSVRPFGKIKIWAGKGEGGRGLDKELVFEGVDSWGVGSEMKTVLMDKEGVERATHTMSQKVH